MIDWERRRKREQGNGALAGHAGERQRALMRRRDAARDREAQASASGLPRTRLINAIKTLAKMRQMLRGNPDTRISIFLIRLPPRDKGAHAHAALQAIVFNGIKYNRLQGSVRVRAFVARGQAYLEVADTGIGIASE